MRKVLIFTFCLGLLTSRAANAQEKGFVTGLVGLSFAETTSGIFGAEAGFNITRSIQIVGVYENMRDVLTNDLLQLISLTSRITNLRIEGKIPAQYLAAGVRYNFYTGGNIVPYFQFDGGVGRIDPELQFFEGSEDITDTVDTQLDETNGALGLAAGVRVNVSDRMTLGGAFKWVNIFTEETLKINTLHFSIGVRF
jgi:opacity protein-like surface antigen